MFINKLKEIWNSHGFEILLAVAIFIILICALFRIGKKGSWNKSFYIPEKRKSFVKKESSGEIECRKVLEKIFKRPFSKARPDFLRNPVTGGNYNLELDCYNPDLKLAVEYNGIQHYKFTPFFHKNQDSFSNQKYRDYMKRDLCEKNGVKLIEVPYSVKIEDIEKYLLDRL